MFVRTMWRVAFREACASRHHEFPPLENRLAPQQHYSEGFKGTSHKAHKQISQVSVRVQSLANAVG